MNKNESTERERMYRHRAEMLEAERKLQAGSKTYTKDEVLAYLGGRHFGDCSENGEI